MTVRLDQLENGLRVVTEHMPGVASAAVGIWVTAGGRHERVDQNGIAHFLEHMAFKGTTTRSARDIAEAIEDVGGYINAYTSRESTAYYARVLKDDLPLALELIADIVRNPAFDPNEIELERGVILQEIGQSVDTPDDVVFDWLQEVAFPDQPIGRTILGESANILRFTQADLSDFVGEHYGPDRMILAAAGAVDHDAVMTLARDLLGDGAPGRQPVEPAAADFHGGERREIKELEQAHFAMAFEGPDYRDPSIHAAQIFATAFGGGMSSRLFQEIRENRGLCYAIFAQTGAYADTGLTTIYAGTSGEQIGELAQITMDELARSADDMSADEVNRARAQIRAGLLMGLESPSNRAERLARMVAIWDRVPGIEEVLERIDAVSVEDVRAHAARTAEAAGSALALYGPVAGAPDLAALKARLAA